MPNDPCRRRYKYKNKKNFVITNSIVLTSKLPKNHFRFDLLKFIHFIHFHIIYLYIGTLYSETSILRSLNI